MKDPISRKRELADQAYCLISLAMDKRQILHEKNRGEKNQSLTQSLEKIDADIKVLQNYINMLGTDLTEKDVSAIESEIKGYQPDD
jgi:formyltetrahydrofolate hydrolase